MRRACLLILCAVFACKRSGDEAAKARIFSPEQPANASAEAKDKLDARALESDDKLAERVLHMKQKEVAQRLGSHKAQQRVQFAWFRGPGLPDGGSEVSVAEESALEQAGDDFSLRLSNDHNQGFELVWTGGQVFVKSLYGAFHERRTDRTDPEGVRERAMGGLAAFDRLARGLKLRFAGEVSTDGHRVARYTVTGFGARPAAADTRELPKIAYPEGHPDPDTARRIELWEKEEPETVSGTVLVDLATGAPYACDLTGHFRVPGKAGAAAELDLHTVLSTSAVGKNLAIAMPKAEPEPSAPHAVKDPLRFLTKEPGAKEPTVKEPGAGKGEAAEPEDEGEEPDEEPPAKPQR
jgi:hypothetical protein